MFKKTKGFTVKVDEKRVKELSRRLKRAGELKSVYRQWGTRYLAETRETFIDNSNGGGDWPKLKPSTMTYKRVTGKSLRKTRGGRRRSRRAQLFISTDFYSESLGETEHGGHVKILRDTGTLFRALSPKAKGNLFKMQDHGVRVGFADTRHPSKGKANISDIARFHQNGSGRYLPRRQILHAPSANLQSNMLDDLERAVKRLLAKNENKSKGR